MTKFLSYFFIALNCISCSTAYVLHWREDKFILFKNHDSTLETSPIVAIDGVILTQDRTPIVRIDPQMPDGSAWVYYMLVVKNTNSQKRTLNLKQLKIEFKNETAPSFFEKDEKNLDHYPLEAKTTYNIPIMFHLGKKMIEENNGVKPLKLVLPIQDKGDLTMELWLWHV